MIRIVVGKPGLDGHDRGAKIVARALRDAGHEVIYTGLHQTPEQIVETAIQEDADLIGLSVLSGAHMTLFRRLIELLAERDASDIVVFGGGIIPEEDIPVLEEIGVAKVFTPAPPPRDHRLGGRALRAGRRGLSRGVPDRRMPCVTSDHLTSSPPPHRTRVPKDTRGRVSRPPATNKDWVDQWI